MITSEAQAPERTTIEIDSLDNFKLLRINNRILVKPLYDTKNYKSKSGLYMTGDIEFEKADNSNRVGKVISLPDSVYFNPKSPNTMDWKTTLQLQVGDIVWYDITEAWNSPVVICGGEEYYMVRYASCIVAKRGEEVICLNAFCLLDPIYDSPDSTILSPKKTLNEWEAIVAYVGEPNERYLNPGYQDAIGVKKGDRVRFRKLRYGDCAAVIFLEDEKYKMFDGKMYRIAQQRDFDCIIS